MENFKLKENEEILFETPANRMRMIILGQGGKLHLTSERVVFTGHGKNIGEGTVSIDKSDIINVRKAFAMPFLPIPNAIKVNTSSGKYKFVVSKRKEWLKRL